MEFTPVKASFVIIVSLIVVSFAASSLRHTGLQQNSGSSEFTDSQTLAHRIIITVEGRADRFDEWQKLIEGMKYGSSIDIIYGSFDTSIDWNCKMRDRETITPELLRTGFQCSSSPVLICLPIVGTTYTPGRNALAKAAYRLQDSRGVAYKYWLFVDEDARHLRCAMCEGAVQENSCCFDAYIQYMLLESVNHASISLSTYAAVPDRQTESNMSYYGPPFGQLIHNCFDSQIQSYHWDAVPLYFPYFEQLEDKSWWETHALAFYFSVGCLPGATIVLGGYGMSNLEHSDYPRGRTAAQDEMAVLKQYVPELYYTLKPMKEDFKGYEQGNCAELPVEGWQEPNYIFGGHTDNGWWRRSTRYLLCRDAMRRRFYEYMRPGGAIAAAIEINMEQPGGHSNGNEVGGTANTGGNLQPTPRRLLLTAAGRATAHGNTGARDSITLGLSSSAFVDAGMPRAPFRRHSTGDA